MVDVCFTPACARIPHVVTVRRLISHLLRALDHVAAGFCESKKHAFIVSDISDIQQASRVSSSGPKKFRVVAKLLAVQPYFVGLCERRSGGGTGVCTPWRRSMAADAGSGDRRHIPTWNGNAAKWESFRDEIRVWRLGENLNVKYSSAARLVSGLSGPARLTCMTINAEQLHPPLAKVLWRALMSAKTLPVLTLS